MQSIDLDVAQAKMVVEDVPDRPGSAARIFRALARAGVVVDMIVHDVSHSGASTLTFTLPDRDRHRAFAVVSETIREIGAAQVMMHGPIAKLSVTDFDPRAQHGISESFFDALANAAVNIDMINISRTEIAVVVSLAESGKALQAVKEALPAG
jgi:aspartate kinase